MSCAIHLTDIRNHFSRLIPIREHEVESDINFQSKSIECMSDSAWPRLAHKPLWHEWNLWQIIAQFRTAPACDNEPIASEMILRKSLFFPISLHWLHIIRIYIPSCKCYRDTNTYSYTHTHTREQTHTQAEYPWRPYICTCNASRAREWDTKASKIRVHCVSNAFRAFLPVSFHLYFGLHSCG